MSKKMEMKKFGGLEWVTVVGVPFKTTKYGPAVDASDLKKVEGIVASYIVSHQVPIRGIEVEYLRKTFGISLGKLGAELGFSATGILKWERSPHKRLERVNEIAMRIWAAEKLGVEISKKFSKLFGHSDEPEHVTLKAA